jgi:hypothetical protein
MNYYLGPRTPSSADKPTGRTRVSQHSAARTTDTSLYKCSAFEDQHIQVGQSENHDRCHVKWHVVVNQKSMSTGIEVLLGVIPIMVHTAKENSIVASHGKPLWG